MADDCSRCEGARWIFDAEDDEGNVYYRPCPVCRPEVHDRFLGGHLEPGHTCPACSARPTTRTTPRRRAEPPSTGRPPEVANEPPEPAPIDERMF